MRRFGEAGWFEVTLTDALTWYTGSHPGPGDAWPSVVRALDLAGFEVARYSNDDGMGVYVTGGPGFDDDCFCGVARVLDVGLLRAADWFPASCRAVVHTGRVVRPIAWVTL